MRRKNKTTTLRGQSLWLRGQYTKINCQSIGLSGGIAQITAKTFDFSASDAILTDAQYLAAPGIQMLPTVAGAIVPTYNLKGNDGKMITDRVAGKATAFRTLTSASSMRRRDSWKNFIRNARTIDWDKT